MRIRCSWQGATALAAVMGVSATAAGQQAPLDLGPGARAAAGPSYDAAPVVGYAYSAFGDDAGVIGASAFAAGAAAPSTAAGPFGGGASVWGAPVERLTLMAQASTDGLGRFGPSAAALVRVAGDAARGCALSLLGDYKAEGFDELGGEAEGGLLASIARGGWHADVNALTGGGFDDGEVDAEARARGGYDVTRWLRAGLDAQLRARLAGAATLPDGRTWDAVGGPQLIASLGPAFGAITAGPTTVGVERRVGWEAIVAVGVVRF